jgi:hypothetical protein
MTYGPPERATGIDVLAKRDELDVQIGEFVEHFKEVLHRACHAIERPNEHDVEPAAAGVVQKFIEPGPFRPGAGDFIRIFTDDLVAALRGHGPQIVELRFRVLVHATHPHIKDGALHHY